MSVELEELFHDLDPAAPTMSVSADAVVASGQRKVRRRRALWGAGTGALAAAAAVAIAVGTALPDSSSTSPMPAHTSRIALGPLFSGATHDGRFTSAAIGSGDSPTPTPATKYEAYRDAHGILRIRRLDDSTTVDLPEVAQFKDGGSATNDRNQTVIIRPVPADVTSASVWLDPNASAKSGYSTSGVVLPDGTTAVAFITDQRINPAKDVGYASWWTTAGQLKASTGEVADTAELPSTGTSTSLRAWSFPTLGSCGVVRVSKDGWTGGSMDASADGSCTVDLGLGLGLGGDEMTFVWMTVRPGPVSNIKATPALGAHPTSVHQSVLSNGRVVLWAMETAKSGVLKNGVFSSVTWTGPDGKAVSYHHDDK